MELPIYEIRDELLGRLRAEGLLILAAPTGSGKTTQVPQMILDAGLAGTEGRIVVLQPRRVAARSVARRVAEERSVILGGEVGYQIRFDDHTSLGTRICFVTEGILLRWLLQNPELKGIQCIIFDEFHERSLLSDVALGYVKSLRSKSRPDLQLVVMSATLDLASLEKYLGGEGLQSAGRSYPVEVRYQTHPDDRPAWDQAADQFEAYLNERGDQSGDTLIFLPGMFEIQAAVRALQSVRTSVPFDVLPLHGDLPPEAQDLVFRPTPPGRRKVIVATNVAETSITINGIECVIDSGLARIARFDAERGLPSLLMETISRASAEQRAGRAGRTRPGLCFRLWTESNHLNRPERNTPEIQRADLAEVVLLLHSLGFTEAEKFDWLDHPEPVAIRNAEQLLTTLGALRKTTEGTGRSDLTPLGWEMLHLPMHPRYARIIVEARRRNCVAQACLCAALVSGRDLLARVPRGDSKASEVREVFEGSPLSDFYTLFRAFHFARNNQFRVDVCRRHGIQSQIAREVAQTYDQFLRIAQTQVNQSPEQENNTVMDDALLPCLIAGFIDQLAVRKDQGTLECRVAGGRTGALMRESVVQSSPWLVAAVMKEIQDRSGQARTLLGLATAVTLEQLRELYPQHFNQHQEAFFDRSVKRVQALTQHRFLDLVVQETKSGDVNPQAAGRTLAHAALQGWFELPNLTHDIKQWMARVNLANAAFPDLGIPAFDGARIQAALVAAFAGLTLAKEAQSVDLRGAFKAELHSDQAELVKELAPESISWPDAKSRKLLYVGIPSEEEEDPTSPRALAPELSIKIHECFPAQTHPFVCEGRVPVRLWVCGPDGKRIEPTLNWPEFRQKTYPKLKVHLIKKYPAQLWA